MTIVLKFSRNKNEHKKCDAYFRKNPHILHILFLCYICEINYFILVYYKSWFLHSEMPKVDITE